jgi:hypothetical protein
MTTSYFQLKNIFCLVFIVLIVFTSQGNAQTVKLKEPIKGWWKPKADSAESYRSYGNILDSISIGDTVNFFHESDDFIPYGSFFYENGKYKRMTSWAWCGTRSIFEKISGLNKTKFRKGKWKIEEIDSVTYFTLKDRRKKIQKFKMILRSDTKIEAVFIRK